MKIENMNEAVTAVTAVTEFLRQEAEREIKVLMEEYKKNKEKEGKGVSCPYEPEETARATRDMCDKLLEAAQAYGYGACSLCQGY